MAAAKKKKKMLRVLLLLLVVAALGAVYFLIDGRDETGLDALPTPTTAPTTENLVLCTLSAEDVTEVSFENDKFSATVLKLEDETYTLKGEPDFPLNQTKAKHVFDNLFKEAEILLENADLSVYGLTEPALRITATDKNGATFHLNVGNRVGTASENKYYACLDNETTVYCVPATLYVPYCLEKAEWIRLEVLPDIDATMIVGLEISNGEHDELALYHNGGIGDTDANPNTGNWRMEEPYSNLLGLNETAVTELIGQYTGISFSDPVDYKTENFALYGLEQPTKTLSIIYEVASALKDEMLKQRMTLHIGNKTDDGYYYVNLKGSQLVYTMKESNVEKLISVEADDLVEKRFALLYIYTVSELEVEMGDVRHLYELQHENAVDESGATINKSSTFFVDGVQVSEDAPSFNTFYTNFLNPKANHVIPEDTQVEGEPFLKLRYKRTEEKYEDFLMEYFPFDDSFYAVRINGVMMYAVDKRAVDTLMEEIQLYAPQ